MISSQKKDPSVGQPDPCRRRARTGGRAIAISTHWHEKTFLSVVESTPFPFLPTGARTCFGEQEIAAALDAIGQSHAAASEAEGGSPCLEMGRSLAAGAKGGRSRSCRVGAVRQCRGRTIDDRGLSCRRRVAACLLPGPIGGRACWPGTKRQGSRAVKMSAQYKGQSGSVICVQRPIRILISSQADPENIILQACAVVL